MTTTTSAAQNSRVASLRTVGFVQAVLGLLMVVLTIVGENDGFGALVALGLTLFVVGQATVVAIALSDRRCAVRSDE